jgi:F plasmid transfer operon, TraF, protein
MIKHFAAITLILFGLSSAAHALEFQPVGNGSLGVGGAGVARTYGSMAPYWNPAGLAFAPQTVTVSLTAGVGLQPGGKLAQDLDGLITAYDTYNSDQTNPANVDTFADAINVISPTDYLRGTGSAALGFQVKHFGFGAYGTFEGGGVPHVSTITPADKIALAGGDLTSLNADYVSISGIAIIEAPISYGYAFDLGPAGKLGIGATAKYLYGEVASSPHQSIFTDGTTLSSKDVTSDLSKSRKGSSSFGIDLGLMWKPALLIPVTVGLVGKNLNFPSFKSEFGERVVVDPQVRAGVDIDALSWLALTADIDVLSNATIVPGLRTQHFGGGIEIHPYNCLKLRVGGYTDLAATTNGAVTGGLSLGSPWVYIDVDGAYGFGSIKYDNRSYPTEAKAQLSMNIEF